MQATRGRQRAYSPILRWMLHRSFAMLLLFSGAAAAIVGACGDPTLPSADEPDSGTATGAVGEGICPSVAPLGGEACLLPEGTTCAFSACGTEIAQCSRGVWRYSGNTPPRPPCPNPEPPAPSSACPPCWPKDVTCRYGSDCSGPNPSANWSVASCPNGRWTLEYYACALADAKAPVPAIVDAGADVQRDAEPDAD
jgi:hypothetical protein